MKRCHPATDHHGNRVLLRHPSTATALDNWHDPSRMATVVPDGAMPATLNGIALDTWQAPRQKAFWETEGDCAELEAPPLHRPKHKKAAAGDVVEEPKGRIGLVATRSACSARS